MIFVFGLGATCISLLITWFVREGVEMTDEGEVVDPPVEPPRASGAAIAQGRRGHLEADLRHRSTNGFSGSTWACSRSRLFVRFVFFHFHYTFPKYGIRVLGEGAKIGSIYGVLNPVLIVFLVPLVAALTKKTSSYKMMIWGSAISSLSCFHRRDARLVVRGPDGHRARRIDLHQLAWHGSGHGIPAWPAPPVPEYWPLILFIIIFTIGEAIWSPRLMQFTAEIAPKGKEGTYIALSVLPYFVAKFFVGPMSGMAGECLHAGGCRGQGAGVPIRSIT